MKPDSIASMFAYRGCGRVALVLFWLAALAPTDVAAQTFPDRPIKIIVPAGPAGSYDLVGRLLADQLSRRLGQRVSVVNRASFGMVAGTQAVATASPDGTTLLVGGLANIVFNAGRFKKLPYDPLADFVPIALVFNMSYTMVGAKSLPYANVREIIDAAHNKPNSFWVATVGVGSAQHIVAAAFQRLTGTHMLSGGFRDSAMAFQHVASEPIPLLLFDSTPAALPFVKSDQVKALAVLAAKRNPQMPDVPTMAEAGVPGLEVDSWIGLFAPARTPPAVIARLRQAIEQSLPELKPRFEADGAEVMEIPFDQLDAFVRSEHARWVKLIRDAGIRFD